MKTSSKNLSKCRVALDVAIETEEFTVVVKEVEKDFVRESSLPGFRKGKAPLAVVKKAFAATMQEETKKRLFQKYLDAAIKAEGLDAVEIASNPEIVLEENGANVKVEVDIHPKFKLPAYKGLKISSKDVAVTDDDVNNYIEHFRDSFAKYEAAEEGDAIKSGDYVQIDYKGTIDGKDIIEIEKEAKFVSGAEGYWLRVKEGYFLPEIIDALIGLKAGEEKSGIKVKFNDTFAPESLKGKKALYDIKVKSFRRYIPATDEQLVEGMKAESLEKLLADTRKKLEENAVRAEASRREDEAFDALMKKVDFEVPKTIVQRQAYSMLSDMVQKLPQDNPAEFAKKFKDLQDEAMKQAETIVRFSYVANEIAKEEKIECKDKELGKKVIEFVLANAKK